MSNLETRIDQLEQQVQSGANKQLDHLGIFFYVLAGMSALFACIPILHFLLGVFIMFAPTRPGEGGEDKVVGVIFILVAGCIILLGWAYAALLFYAGRGLRTRTRPTLVTVAAALSCLNMPFGTALGVITLIEMNKPEIRNLFKRQM